MLCPRLLTTPRTHPPFRSHPSPTPPANMPPANTPPGALAPSTPRPLTACPLRSAAPQDVTSVFENYAWQIYGGYTFLRFFELPGITPSMNGFNYSVVYYWKDWFKSSMASSRLLTQPKTTSAPGSCSAAAVRVFAGPRKKASRSGRDALAGYSHFTPQTPAGHPARFRLRTWRRRGPALQGALGIAFGRRRHVQLRYFNTYQYSPIAHAGVVFRF